MKKYKIYNNWLESYFIERLNRFTLLVKLKNGKTTHAYLPNTGRLFEHLYPGNKIFLTSVKTEKFNYKVVSTYYQNSYMFLDTVKLNSLFNLFIENGKIEINDFKNPVLICSEYSIKNHRFDFFLRNHNSIRNLIEIKSCTLCHNKVAMFPDAPSKRALSHITLLSALSNSGFKPWIIFLISHAQAERFVPNLHTDPNFTDALINSDNLNIAAFSYKMIDPVTIDLDSPLQVKIDLDIAKSNLTISGNYLLILKNNRNIKLKIGKLGEISFKKGYYVYVGSALNGLDQRLKRHYRKIKNKRWHIDYISPEPMKPVKDFKIRRKDRIEDEIAKEIMQTSNGQISGFGSSDSKLNSHLFYFHEYPLKRKDFLKIILNYQTFTEKSSL